MLLADKGSSPDAGKNGVGLSHPGEAGKIAALLELRVPGFFVRVLQFEIDLEGLQQRALGMP